MKNDKIIIKGARENNLKNIDLVLPKNKLIVFTGVSGSGKSTLAFDTIYNEGKRRYMDSLSSYARQFLGGVEKPDVDSIDGLSPAISIDQKTTSHNPRSTVGTVTEIYDYLRLLYSRIGVAYCPNHNEPIIKFTPKQMVDIVSKKPLGSRIYILAPLVNNEKGTHKDLLNKFHLKGFERFRVDGEVYRFSDIPSLEKNKKHNIDIVVDRLILKADSSSRLYDSLQTALDVSNGYVVIKDENEEKLFSEHAACKYCGFAVPQLEPRLFSFNNPIGACSECSGLGIKREVAEDLLIPDESLSINKGAVSYFKNQVEGNNIEWQEFKMLCDYHGISRDVPYNTLTRKQKNTILFGSEEQIRYQIVSNSGNVMNRVGFEGIKSRIDRLYKTTDSVFKRDWFETYMRDTECTECKGARLNEMVLSVKLNGLNIHELCSLSLVEVMKFFDELKLTKEQEDIAHLVLIEVKNRIQFLINVGLDYLSLARMAMTLSGGEAQRIRLATQIGSKLTGVLYVLDEPSIGLHQKDNDRLINSLKEMRDLGNTLIVVEHDEDTMLQADYLVDIGPGAGVHGGNIVAAGTPSEVMENPSSLTGEYLKGEKFIPFSSFRNKGNGNYITIKNARCNNLKNVNVDIPLGCFVCVTGVSGSGKSSLVTETLYKNVYNKLSKGKQEAGKVDSIEGIENIDKVINISQEAIGKTPRSNPATYIGVFDDIRELFASTKEARAKGFVKSRFSFNVRGGRCEACEGDGVKRISMSFFPDVYVMCEECRGKRYNEETLSVVFKGKNIYDVLEMTCEDACEFFKSQPGIYKKIKTLCDVGLGYIKLGQSSTTLSGGEAQRVKLAYELSKRATGKTLYILDEPTTGLHVDDVRMLLNVLKTIIAGGNSVVVIEHNLDMIKCADYIIDLGPDGGDRGGEIVVKGTPEVVSQNKTSYTGIYLKKILERDERRIKRYGE